ncbi:SEC14-like protein 2, partial [Armadillidium vulgare]
LPVHWGGTMTDPDGNTKFISKVFIYFPARNFNINKAEAMLLKRSSGKEWNMDNIADWNPPEVLKKYFPSGVAGYDKEGNPVIIIPYGNVDIRGLIKSSNSKELIKYFAQIFENAALIMRERSRERGEPMGKLIDICLLPANYILVFII